jgi:hypothetical protein
MLEAPPSHRNCHYADHFLTFMQEAVSIFPRRMGKVDHVGWNLALVANSIEENLGLGASRLDGYPKRAYTRLKLRKHANEIRSLKVLVRGSEVARAPPFTEEVRGHGRLQPISGRRLSARTNIHAQ